MFIPLIAVKSAVKLSLPDIKTKMSLYVKFDNSYYDSEKYCKWEARGFEIDPFHFQGNKIHRLKRLGYLDKKRSKTKHLKVKLLSSESMTNVEDLEELFTLKKDVLVFVTGGGFVSDFEKIAQFYLREIAKDLSIPVFIIKYR